MSREDALADTLRIDYTQADLTPRERAMLDYVHKLTLTPKDMREEDVASLRAVGFDDLGILHIVLLASWFNYINRVADGLGIAVEAHTWEALAQSGPIPWKAEHAENRVPRVDGLREASTP